MALHPNEARASDRPKHRALGWLAAVTAAVITLVATVAAAGSTGAAPKRGGILKVGRVADVVTFDPVFQTDNMSIWAKLLVFQLLVRSSADGKGVVPDLAYKWSHSPDQKTWTFYLRPTAHFSDGAPVTSKDVKFTFDRVIHSQGSWSASLFPPLTISTPSAKKVVFHLKQKWAPFLADVSVHSAAIVPQKYFQKVGAKKFADKPIGSGPFMVTQWRKGNEIVLKRNPGFWDKSRPYVNELDLLVLPDDNTRMLKVQSGEIDVGEDVPFNQIDKLKNAHGLTVKVQPYYRIDWIQFNEKNAKFKSAKVRQAINYAVDKNAIIKSVLFGYGQAPTSFLPKMTYTNTVDKPYLYDLAKAKNLMASSPYPKGFSTTVTVVSGDTIGSQVATVVKSELKQIGIDVQIRQLEGATQYNDLALGKYEMAEGYMTSDIVDPSELIAYAGAGDQGSYSVWTWYDNKTVDKLAADGLKQLDAAKRASMYLQMQRLVFRDAPYLWLYWSPARTAVRSNVDGYSKLPTGNYWLENVSKS